MLAFMEPGKGEQFLELGVHLYVEYSNQRVEPLLCYSKQQLCVGLAQQGLWQISIGCILHGGLPLLAKEAIRDAWCLSASLREWLHLSLIVQKGGRG